MKSRLNQSVLNYGEGIISDSESCSEEEKNAITKLKMDQEPPLNVVEEFVATLKMHDKLENEPLVFRGKKKRDTTSMLNEIYDNNELKV